MTTSVRPTGPYRSYSELAALLAGLPRRPLRIRYAHQPNALASMAVLLPCAVAAVATDTSAAGNHCRTDWVAVDFDGADDEQLLRVRLPRLNPVPGTRSVATVGRRAAGQRLAASLPSTMAVPRLASLARDVTAGALALRHRLAAEGWAVHGRHVCRDRVTEALTVLEDSLRRHPRLCDAYAAHNRWMLEQLFGVRVDVVGGTEWLVGQAGARQRALLTVAHRRPELTGAGVWRVCARCHVRTRAHCRFAPDAAEVEEATCVGCGSLLRRVPLDLGLVVDSPAGPCPAQILPVHLDDLVERLTGPEHDLAVHYPGSYTHLAAALAALAVLRDDAPDEWRNPPPDWCATHLEQNIFADILPTRTATGSAVGDDHIRAAQLLYRSSALMSWSVLAEPLTNVLANRITGSRPGPGGQ